MKLDCRLLVGAWLVVLVCALSAAAALSKEDEEDGQEMRKNELFLLAKLLHNTRSKDDASASKADIGDVSDVDKRQGGASWDMDYGWGGGRFGKRADMLDYGWGGGRFGKRAEMLDYGWGGGRFGKRGGEQMLDYGWGGGRFGKRSADRYGGRGRYGRDVDHVDPADIDQ